MKRIVQIIIAFILMLLAVTSEAAQYDYVILSDEQIICIEKRQKLEQRLNARYVFGAPVTLNAGDPVDCSLLYFRMFFA